MDSSSKSSRKIKEGFLGQKMTVLPPNIKKRIVQNALIKHFYVTAIGFYPHASFHVRERRSGCSQYIFLYCTGGNGTVSLRGNTYTLLPNHFLILPKNIPHQYQSSLEEPWSLYWIHFSGDYADLVYHRYAELKSEPVFTAYEEGRIARFDQLFQLVEDRFEDRNLEIANISALDFLSSFIYGKEIDPGSLEHDKISDSIAFMKGSLGKQLGVEDFAQQQHLSVTHYSRLFRNKTGSSPNQYFNELKIQKSCQYLYFTDRSIKEICQSLGINDPYYFSRLFKKLIGISPAKYKAQHKKD